MASTYTTGFGIEKIGSGEQSGAWGTTTNHNLDILDRIASYKAVALSGSTHTLTVREASPGSGTENLQDGMYRVIKFTGALGANNTVTIAPNTAPAYFIFENATTDSGSSGPYSVILTQGSGANITIQNGKNAIVYCDGAGSGAAVVNALSDLQIATLEVTGVAALDGAVTVGGILSVDDTTTSTSGTTGSIHTDGGLGVAGTAFVAGAATVGGASQFNSTVTVGVNDTGYNVKFFGATSGKYMLWDESADILLFTDATKAVFGTGSDFSIQHDGSHTYLQNSTGNISIQAKTGEESITAVPDGAVTLYFNDAVKIATTSTGINGTGTATFAPTNGSTDTVFIEAGSGRSGNGYAFLDLIGDATYSDYGLRLIRNNGGANATASLEHKGTGTFTINTDEAAPILFSTNSAEAMRILSGGTVGIGTSVPAQFVQISKATAGDTTSLLVSNPNGAGGASAALKLGVSSEDDTVAKFAIIHERFDSYGRGDTYFCSNYTASTEEVADANAVIAIDGSSAYVGIGTKSPATKLQVNGTLGIFSNTQTVPTPDNGAVPVLVMGGNFSNGGGEQSFWNTAAGLTGGFRFSQVTGSGAYNDILYLQKNLTRFYIGGAEKIRMDSSGRLLAGASTIPGSATSANLYSAGAVAAGTGFYAKAGTAATTHGNIFNINWTGSVAQLWIDATNLGTISVSSDYRIKRNISTQTEPALNKIKALRPVTYQMADYGTLFKSNDAIKEGFIAHEVQEIIPSGADGVKDDENTIQSLRVDAILAVVVKAMQEQQVIIESLKTRITALEG